MPAALQICAPLVTGELQEIEARDRLAGFHARAVLDDHFDVRPCTVAVRSTGAKTSPYGRTRRRCISSTWASTSGPMLARCSRGELDRLVMTDQQQEPHRRSPFGCGDAAEREW
jgi:hypothetical protein